MNNAHKKQLLTYLRLTGLKLGYLLNFGGALMKDGTTRTVNRLDEDEQSLAILASWREKRNTASHGDDVLGFMAGVYREECLLQASLTLPGARGTRKEKASQ